MRFGGCLYTRPASRGLLHQRRGSVGTRERYSGGITLRQRQSWISTATLTELYRLRGEPCIADLDSEDLTALETGFENENISVAVFAERTRNFLFRDSEAFNVSDGRTRSMGVEFSGQRQVGRHEFQLAATYAKHEYDFTRDADADGREAMTKKGKEEGRRKKRWIAHAAWRTAISDSLNTNWR